jgi:ABC-type lipoprotein release transport system permease subunit
MRTLRSWVVRLLSLFRRRQLEERLEEELGFHLEMEAREHQARGMSPEAARRAARAALAPSGPGWSVESLKEEMRARRGVPALETLGQDLRYALRMMRKSPGFTAVALLSMAFGVGTNCAIFSVVDALLLKPLPVAGADRLVVLEKSRRGDPMPLFSYPAWRLLQQARVCSGVMAMTHEFLAVVRPLAPQAPPGTPAPALPPAPREPLSPAAAGGPRPASPPGGAAVAADGAGEAFETATAQLVSGNFFSTLGVGMAVGRSFLAEEDAVPGGHPLAVISYGYWQRRFGRDRSVLGRALQVNGLTVTVIGVARRGFHGAIAEADPDLFLPVTLRELVKYRGAIESDGPDLPGRSIFEQVNDHWLQLLACRRPGVSVERASAVLNVLFQRDKAARLMTHTDSAEGDRRELMAERVLLEPAARGLSRLRPSFTQPLLILMAVSGLVLVIACANLANLLLARADRRRKEMALRLGIGAGRGRLLRQLLTESLLLAGLGGALGVAGAGWGSQLLLGLASRGASPIPLDVGLDWRLLVFALGVALATGVGFGLAPALQATRVDLAANLKEGAGAIGGGMGSGASGAGGAGGRLGQVLVAAQIGLSLVLLIGAGLFVGSLRNLMEVDTGVVSNSLVLVAINPLLLGYDDKPGVPRPATGGAAADDRLTALYPRLVERLEAVPGVRSASLSDLRLLSGSSWEENVVLPGYIPRPDEDMDVEQRVVTPRYFETLGLPLVAGRGFRPADRQGAQKVVIVDEAMVRRFWPRAATLGAGAAAAANVAISATSATSARSATSGPSAGGVGSGGAASVLGQRFGFGPPGNSRNLEIVGVVRNVRSVRLGQAPPPTAYLPVAQRPRVLHDLEVRLAGGNEGPMQAGVIAALRRAIAEVEPNLPVFSVITMGEQVERSLARERAVARLTGFFGALALLLAAIGLYGVMSYSVARRTNEIGLRMALGAPRAQVLGLVMRDTARLVAAGVAAGLVAAVATTRLAASQLFGLGAFDPPTVVTATLAMVAVALAAGFLPARRAADTDSMVALRHE